MKAKTISAIFAVSAVISAVVLYGFYRISAPSPAEKRKIEVLSDQSFVFNGKTNKLTRFRTVGGFCGQNEFAPCLMAVSDYFEKYHWPKDRPVQILEKPDCVIITWPVPPEVEKFRFRPDYWFRAYVDKKTLKIVRLLQGG